ncbi:MAG: YkgJ family cysteine cluster protein [Desulfobacteraceae bacterium]|nr:MAG: YkgJ family cysteine cluster protein [Desulfobacteraceae bacterium]
MKFLDPLKLAQITGRPIQAGETFGFACHSDLGCFTRCCRNLNLFLYPYDMLRLKTNLNLTSDQFIDRHVDIVLRDGHHFPEVLLRMADDEQHSCPFLAPSGCRVYADRPHTCRTFPVEQGVLYDAATRRGTPISFFRPPDFCLGRYEVRTWSIETWNQDQESNRHHDFNLSWAELRRLFENDPWGAEGPRGARAKMVFMAAYNLDPFRDFVFSSTFLNRFHVKAELVKKLRRSDEALLTFGFEWIRIFVWGQPSKMIRMR